MQWFIGHIGVSSKSDIGYAFQEVRTFQANDPDDALRVITVAGNDIASSRKYYSGEPVPAGNYSVEVCCQAFEPGQAITMNCLAITNEQPSSFRSFSFDGGTLQSA